MSNPTEIISGKKYGKLTAIKFIEKNKHNFWLFRCDCGIEKKIRTDGVYSGKVISCGCHKNKNLQDIIHGMSKNRLYKIWVGMKERCYNKKHKEYKNYGNRGITVCDRWKNSFVNFLEDMGKSYINNLTIDRIDNNGNYCKKNCRWATIKEQQRNKRTNYSVYYKGIRYCLSELSEKFGIKYECLYKRIVILKWDIEKSLINKNFNYKYVKSN